MPNKDDLKLEEDSNEEIYTITYRGAKYILKMPITLSIQEKVDIFNKFLEDNNIKEYKFHY